MQKKQANRIERILLASLFSIVSISSVASITGTVAWYQYVLRAGASLTGTSVRNEHSLKMGLRTWIPIIHPEYYGLYQDPNESDIYWAYNELTNEAITYVLDRQGFASNVLFPVTTGSWDDDNTFRLRKNPMAKENRDATSEIAAYTKLSFVFKGVNDKGEELINPYAIYLKSVMLDTSNQLSNAVRMTFSSNTLSTLLFNPSSDNDGYTSVGGPLDLDLDGYLDVYNDGKECVYGEADEVVYSDSPTSGESVRPKEDRTTFNGVHKPGSYTVDLTQSSFKKAHYYGYDSVVMQKELTRYNPSVGYASLDMRIFIEGWDKSLTDEVEGTSYSLLASFEMVHINE